MNNILNFEKYRSLVRLYEYKNKYNHNSNIINEGIVDKVKKKISGEFVGKILDEEIELGKQVEDRIKTTMGELSKVCDTLKVNDNEGSKFKKSLNDLIDDINKTSFDTLSLLGDERVDFNGFKKHVVLANLINLRVLLSPVKNALMIKRAYQYFIGLIKQSIRKDLVMLLINFDQFQNMILQKSLESEENANLNREMERYSGKLDAMYQQILVDTVGNKSAKLLDKIKKAMDVKVRELDVMDKHNPMRDFFMNSYDNTYKQTAESLKSLISEDNQKQIESYKNSIVKISSAEKESNLGVYGELLISIAEENALKTTVAIHTNFLKISEVFKLSNQKKLVEMMQKAEKEYLDEIEDKKLERKKLEREKANNDRVQFILNVGRKLLKSLKTFDDYEKLTDDIEGPNGYTLSKKELVKRYLSSGKPTVISPLKVLIPVLNSNDNGYDESYISYLDILANKARKALGDNNNKKTISSDNINDADGWRDLVNKMKSSNAKNALKIISDDIVKFDYKLFLSKLMDADKNNGADLNDKTYKEFEEAFEYLKKYKDNDYSGKEKE